jgi:hypothetical protein
MATAGHAGTNISPQKEVTTNHPGNIALSSGLTPSLQALIRKLVAQAHSGSGTSPQVRNERKEEVIIDAEVDGVR